MVLLKVKDLEYPLKYTAKIIYTHSCDDLLSYTLYNKHLLFSPFLCSDSTRMLISSYIASSLQQLDLYACTSFPLAVRLPVRPRPDFGISSFSKDT
jgi:hypothetical protein